MRSRFRFRGAVGSANGSRKGLSQNATTLASAAYANLVAAAVSMLPAVASGIMAWQWQLDGRRLRGVLLLHFALGVLSGILIGVIGWIHFRAGRSPGRPLSDYRLPLEFITAVIVIFTAHLGGFLSGVNVPG